MAEKNQVQVREATWMDYPEVCHLAITEAVAEGAGSHYPPPAFPDVYISLLDVFAKGAGWVGVHEGRIVAVLLVDMKSCTWNQSREWVESVHFWVLEPYRKGGVAAALIGLAKEAANRRGVPLRIATSFGKAPDVLDRWMQQQGGSYVGGNFYFPAPKDNQPELPLAHEAA